MIRHFVFLKYPVDTPGHVKRGIVDDLTNLRQEVDGFLAFGSAPNVSPEADVVRGFKDMFWIDFRDAAARDRYLQNTTHIGIASRIIAAVEDGANGVFVCDIELP